MFQRVIVDDLAFVFSILSFVIFAGLHVLVIARALRMGAAERKHLASLPLEDHAETPTPR